MADSPRIPAQSRSLLDLIDQLRDEFPALSRHTVVRCVSIVANDPSSTGLLATALLRRTERIARARLTHLNELPVQSIVLDPTIVTIPRARTDKAAAARPTS